MYRHALLLKESNNIPDCIEKNNWNLHTLTFPGLYPIYFFYWLTLNYIFNLINHNYEYNSFQCCWILLKNNKNWRWCWGARIIKTEGNVGVPELKIGVIIEGSFGNCSLILHQEWEILYSSFIFNAQLKLYFFRKLYPHFIVLFFLSVFYQFLSWTNLWSSKFLLLKLKLSVWLHLQIEPFKS